LAIWTSTRLPAALNVGALLTFVAAGLLWAVTGPENPAPTTPKLFRSATATAGWPVVPLTMLAFGLLTAGVAGLFTTVLTMQ
jgi:hypothetical protein